jgi:hypothetical protein
MLRLTGASWLAFGLVAVAVLARAQPVPLGSESVVNTYTSGLQGSPAIASDGSGNVVIVWAGSGSIRGQRYDQSGLPNGTEFAVTANDAAYGPAVAMDADGNFLVTWKLGTPEVVARSYGSDGQARGSEFRVDSTIFDYQHGYPHGYGPERKEGPAQAARAPNGEFVVIWSAGYNEYLYRVHERRVVRAQLLTSDGSFDGSEFTVGGDMYYYLSRPAVGSSSDGEFVVAWNQVTGYSYPEPGNYYYAVGNYDLRARRPGGTGPQAAPFTVEADVIAEPSIASDGAHRFIVVWGGVFARRFDDQTQPLEPRLQVNSSQRGVNSDARVAATDAGNFVVVWTSGGDQGGDGSGGGVFARSFASDAAPQGTEIAVNTSTAGEQGKGAVTFADENTIVVAWQSEGLDGSESAVVTRRFARAPACGDASADGATNATDALIALQTVVGIGGCAACVCDSDDSGAITATDALRILQAAVGGTDILACRAC